MYSLQQQVYRKSSFALASSVIYIPEHPPSPCHRVCRFARSRSYTLQVSLTHVFSSCFRFPLFFFPGISILSTFPLCVRLITGPNQVCRFSRIFFEACTTIVVCSFFILHLRVTTHIHYITLIFFKHANTNTWVGWQESLEIGVASGIERRKKKKLKAIERQNHCRNII